MSVIFSRARGSKLWVVWPRLNMVYMHHGWVLLEVTAQLQCAQHIPTEKLEPSMGIWGHVLQENFENIDTRYAIYCFIVKC